MRDFQSRITHHVSCIALMSEIPTLLEAVYQEYGYDFRDYAPASLKRRVWKCVWEEGVTSVPELSEKILGDPDCLERFLLVLSTNMIAMFRDPGFYLACRQKVLPLLRTYPHVQVWQVGCSTGEELYSLAILLWEEGLHERTRIYATDTNETILRQAQAGTYPLSVMPVYNHHYSQAGGQRPFSEYYTVQGNQAVFHQRLQKNVVWSTHQLVTDASFNEFHLIFCRNVMIYLNQSLQERVLRLLYDSLVRSGVLALGRQESLPLTPWAAYYEPIDGGEKLYRRIGRAL
jgi:chemotaxis protein methyltransferase CheR